MASDEFTLIYGGIEFEARVVRSIFKKPGAKRLKERFAIAFPHVVDVRKLLPWDSDAAMIADVQPVGADGPWTELVVYQRKVPNSHSAPTIRPKAPPLLQVVALDDALAEDTFWAVIDRSLLSGRDSESVVVSIVESLSPTEAPRFWATQQLLLDALAAVVRAEPSIDLTPGTDSFEYWALGYIYSGRTAYESVLAGRNMGPASPPLVDGEWFTRVPESAMSELTGVDVTFLRAQDDSATEFDPGEGGESGRVEIYSGDDPHLIGSYFEVLLSGEGVKLECVGLQYLNGRFEDDIRSQALEFVLSTCESLGGRLVSDPVIDPSMGSQLFSGVSFIDLDRAWVGSGSEYLESAGLPGLAP